MLGYVSTHFTNIFQGYLTRNEVIVIPDIGVFVVFVGGDVATDFIHIQRHFNATVGIASLAQCQWSIHE